MRLVVPPRFRLRLGGQSSRLRMEKGLPLQGRTARERDHPAEHVSFIPGVVLGPIADRLKNFAKNVFAFVLVIDEPGDYSAEQVRMAAIEFVESSAVPTLDGSDERLIGR